MDKHRKDINQLFGDTPLIAGCLLIFASFFLVDWLSLAICLGAGLLLIAVLHLFVPFDNPLARYRYEPLVEPSHIAKASDAPGSIKCPTRSS